MKNKITQQRLREVVTYDPQTGIFTWKSTGAGRRSTSAGTPSGNGYCYITIDRVKYYAHHLAWLWARGVWPDYLDHKDGNGENNTLSNLRVATHAENRRNNKIATNNASGTTGVSWETRKKRWVAYIQVDGQTKHLGKFLDISDAIAARHEAERAIFGQFSRSLSA